MMKNVSHDYVQGKLTSLLRSISLVGRWQAYKEVSGVNI